MGEQGYVARHSAKEFAVLMPNYDIFSARNLAESIQKQILHMRNDSADYKLKILTVSVGISAAPYAWMKKMRERNPIMNIFISPMNPRSMR